MADPSGSARERQRVAGPLRGGVAWFAVARCVVVSLAMMLRRKLRWPRGKVGTVVRFADGTEGRVYRETVADQDPRDPCFLAISFRLRWVHGHGHAVFRWESILNTPLFVGFAGFGSKLWLAHDDNGVYRGLYEWDGADAAERYARSLWRVLQLVSEPGSIDYRVFPGVRRDDVLEHPDVLTERTQPGEQAWWRVVGTR